MQRSIPFLIVLFASMGLQAQTSLPEPLKSIVHRNSNAIMIDGRISEKEWKGSTWSDAFGDITGNPNKPPIQQTFVRMLWDDNHLYVGAKLMEHDLWATLMQHDDIIFRDNDFEVFIDPNNDGSQYFELEINALGTVMDLFMHKTYKKGGPMDMKWNSTGMKSAVYLQGTLNNNADQDKYWTVEMAIPFECLKREGRISHAKEGQTWRINFSRVQWQLEKTGTGYAKKMGPDGKRIPEDNWVWSPQGPIDMHIPERWGYITFAQ